ncbi:MAG TPA: beta-galactosidase [Candidatus Merdousia gallistercoris]|nr:beta-galactosidase [Candidatus Merdousia gallistercoris]
MRKTIPAIIAICAFACAGFSQWKPAGDKIKTEWADKVDPQNVLPEYPRPIMERPQWLNLNGLWDYAITKKDAPLPKTFDGKILVPFAIESSLSGVGKTIKADQSLWYERKFQIPEDWKGKNVLLNFGAVDWKAEVFVNGNKIGEHTGGYTPFSFNITKNLKDGENSLAVRVWDSTGNGLPRGKQIENPRGIFYTSVSGIWQTVWLEPVSASHISGLKITPDLDSSSFDIKVDSDDKSATATIKVLDNGKVVAQTTAAANKTANIPVKNPKLWWPKSPFLYDLEITLSNKGGEQVDSVKSYAAMRKFSIAKHGRFGGVDFTLNNKKFFTFGPLDQGWWPDGLYTAPTDEALKFDIQRTKDLGFNSIRKHVKVEPARWYTHCDRLGMVVWQDMPSMFGEGNGWQPRGFFQGEERTVSKKFEETYRKEWKEIMESLHSYPCIAIWVPFNEAWGQFKTKEITEWTKSMDPSRLVNSASGGNYFDCGDIVDSHDYGNPIMYMFNNQKVNVVGEYGGIGCAVDGHLWVKDKNWGYGKMRSQEEVTKRFVELTNRFIDMTKYGCFGAIYTQTTDVEIEVNGLFTYDRKVLKVDEEKVREVNQKLSNIFN